MNYRDPKLRARLVDEYVLGTLGGPARRRFEQLLHTDANLRTRVEEVSQRWNSLVEILPEESPNPAVWQAVEKRITPPDRLATAPGWWESFAFWRGWAGLSTAVAALLAVYIWIADPETVYTVVITDDAHSRAGWVLSATNRSSTITVQNLRPQPLPAGRSFQLWIKLADERNVIPVGLIPADGRTKIELVDLLRGRLADAEKFGVSIEPAGGSPTGQPTTTPLYHGPVFSL